MVPHERRTSRKVGRHTFVERFGNVTARQLHVLRTRCTDLRATAEGQDLQKIINVNDDYDGNVVIGWQRDPTARELTLLSVDLSVDQPLVLLWSSSASCLKDAWS